MNPAGLGIDDIEMSKMDTMASDGYLPRTRSNRLQNWTGITSTLSFLMLIVILGLAASAVEKLNRPPPSPSTSVTTIYQSLGLETFEGKSWTDISTAGYGTVVKLNMFGPNLASAWFKTWLAPKMEQEYGIDLQVTEIADTLIAVNEITNAVATNGPTTPGNIDMVWINGANFKNMKTGGLLYGPWTTKVPSADNFDWKSPELAYDFGEPTQGYEMPFFAAQMVFIYRSDLVPADKLPQSMADLVAAMQTPAHPLYGKFTYAAPGAMSGSGSSQSVVAGDFTGAAFLRMFMYEFGGGYDNFQGNYDAAKLASVSPAVLAELKKMEAGIYQSTSGGPPHYCVTQAECDTLFASGAIHFTMSYSPSIVGTKIASNTWQPDTNSYVPASGSIGNVNFMSIPVNAPNKFGALLVGNYVGSLAAQFSRRSSPARWIMSYSLTCPGYVDEEVGGWEAAFEYLAANVNYPTTPATKYFRAPYALPEPNGAYATQIDINWYACLIGKETLDVCPP